MPTDRSPTLQTIADMAGVSRSSVSLALRNDPALRAATRTRIQRIATELGYRPNPMVSALMAHLKTARPAADCGTIAFLTSHGTRDGWRHAKVFRDYFDGAAEQAARFGYRLEEFWLKEPRMTAARMTLILETRGVVGVVVAPFPAGRGHLSLDVGRFASVALGYSMTRPKLHRATNHHMETIRTALREIRRRGYRRVALALHDVQARRVNYNLSAGYMTFQETLPADERLAIFQMDGKSPSDLRTWIRKHGVQAILFGSPDECAWLDEAGLRVPEDMAVALVGDFDRTSSRWAGVDQRGAVTGAAAIDMIVGQVHRNERGVPEYAKIVMTEGTWVDGDSLPTLPNQSARPGAVGEGPAVGVKKTPAAVSHASAAGQSQRNTSPPARRLSV